MKTIDLCTLVIFGATLAGTAGNNGLRYRAAFARGSVEHGCRDRASALSEWRGHTGILR